LRDEQGRMAAPADPLPCAVPATPLERAAASRAAAHEQRQGRYGAVQALYRDGVPIAEIGRRLHLTRPTVRKLTRMAACPEPAARPRLLTPFEPYLRCRWAQGCRNARTLCEELRALGYQGSYPHLRQALCAWREGPARRGRSARMPTPPPPPAPPALRLLSPRRTTWLLLQPAEGLATKDRAFLTHLLDLCPEARTLQALAQAFGALLRERDGAALEPWLRAAEASGCPEMRGFAEGLRRDRAAVDAALTLEWSQGPTEGKVNKIKTTKRAMYGRATFDLLRRRVLHAA
jgi:hypothetical protein